MRARKESGRISVDIARKVKGSGLRLGTKESGRKKGIEIADGPDTRVRRDG